MLEHLMLDTTVMICILDFLRVLFLLLFGAEYASRVLYRPLEEQLHWKDNGKKRKQKYKVQHDRELESFVIFLFPLSRNTCLGLFKGIPRQSHLYEI